MLFLLISNYISSTSVWIDPSSAGWWVSSSGKKKHQINGKDVSHRLLPRVLCHRLFVRFTSASAFASPQTACSRDIMEVRTQAKQIPTSYCAGPSVMSLAYMLASIPLPPSLALPRDAACRRTAVCIQASFATLKMSLVAILASCPAHEQNIPNYHLLFPRYALPNGSLARGKTLVMDFATDIFTSLIVLACQGSWWLCRYLV